jgi:hypothetical protein
MTLIRTPLGKTTPSITIKNTTVSIMPFIIHWLYAECPILNVMLKIVGKVFLCAVKMQNFEFFVLCMTFKKSTVFAGLLNYSVIRDRHNKASLRIQETQYCDTQYNNTIAEPVASNKSSLLPRIQM